MMKHLKAGWRMALWNPLLIAILFLYQLAWGWVLYRFVQSIVLPLMHRYPGQSLSEQWHALFLAEGQFQLIKTNLTHSYLWTLAFFLFVRLLCTPLLYAGFIHNIQQTADERPKSLIAGIRKWGIPFCILYWIRIIFAFAPFYWVYPYLNPEFLAGQGSTKLLITVLPYAAAYLAYIGLLKLLTMYIQFGIVARTNWSVPLRLSIKHILPIILLSLMILLISCLTYAVSMAISMFYAGLLAVLLYQVQHLCKALFRLWELTTQHHFWSTKID